jgi:anaerobic selenocysteine-containing dehydrogenase
MTALEIADATLRASGWPGVEELRQRRWIDAQGNFRASHFLDGFGFPDKRFRFAPDWAAAGKFHTGLPKLPDHFAANDATSRERPFRLVAAPARSFLNTTFTEIPAGRKRERRPTALLHPADAARLGVAEGGRVRLGNERGEIVVHARLFDGMQAGVVIVESIWPNSDFEGGIGVNALVSDEPAMPAGGAVFHDTAVWAEAAAAGLAMAAE